MEGTARILSSRVTSVMGGTTEPRLSFGANHESLSYSQEEETANEESLPGLGSP